MPATRGKSTGWASPQALDDPKVARWKAHANGKVKKAKKARSTKSSYLPPKSPGPTPLYSAQHSLPSDESDGPVLPRNPVYRPRNSAFQPSGPNQPRSPGLFNSQPQPQASILAYRTAIGPQSTDTSLGQAPRMIPTNTAVRFGRPSVSSGESFERRLSQAAFGRAAFSTHRRERLPTNTPVNRGRHSSSASPRAPRPSTMSPSTEPQVAKTWLYWHHSVCSSRTKIVLVEPVQ